jgi:hypothetical protein
MTNTLTKHLNKPIVIRTGKGMEVDKMETKKTGNTAEKTEKTTVPEGSKRCTKCGEIKEATCEFFHKSRGKKDGLSSQCKDCSNKRRRQKYESPEEKERARKYRSDNIEHYRQYNREYSKKYAEKKREYRKKNEEHIREYDKKYKRSPVAKLSEKLRAIRKSGEGAPFVRDLPIEQKETLANLLLQSITLKQAEKEYLESCGQKICKRCERVLSLDCFNFNNRSTCRECVTEIYNNRPDVKAQRKRAEKRAEKKAEKQRVYCNELKTEYKSANEAARVLGLDQGAISRLIREDGRKTGYNKYEGGLSFQLVYNMKKPQKKHLTKQTNATIMW